jgi:hypothetical protein
VHHIREQDLAHREVHGEASALEEEHLFLGKDPNFHQWVLDTP